MIYHLFQNSVWKVVKIAKTSDLESTVASFFARDCTYIHNQIRQYYHGIRNIIERMENEYVCTFKEWEYFMSR